ncbi:hypothetical protein [Agilicoccus flavus]|uniref:hypothetical protein n=1 Tax=Agilicoccus flavus TaxID=2775968 RepID=UPI001CF6A6C5|nr:hypothetical protein [Agilicoccus flavus]
MSGAQGWRWRGTDAAGAPVTGVDAGPFPTQGEAEAWLGEAWADLSNDGVAAVTLCRGDVEVYGPMSLEAG